MKDERWMRSIKLYVFRSSFIIHHSSFCLHRFFD